MPSGQASIRDLVEAGAAQHAIAPRKLWKWTLDAIAHGVIAPILPQEMSLDTRFVHGGMPLTWRKVFVGALLAVERNLPSNNGWAKNLILDVAVFDRWLEKVIRDQELVDHPKRSAGRKPTIRDSVTSFIAQKYHNDIPAGASDKIIAAAFEAETGTPVSVRTVRRARGRK